MKHLLIILSFLLLSSTVIGEETGVLYLYETSTGIKWKTLGVGQVQPKYEGEITYGEPNGKGIETFPNGEKYVGEFKENEPWNVKEYDKNGNNTGKFVNGKMINQ